MICKCCFAYTHKHNRCTTCRLGVNIVNRHSRHSRRSGHSKHSRRAGTAGTAGEWAKQAQQAEQAQQTKQAQQAERAQQAQHAERAQQAQQEWAQQKAGKHGFVLVMYCTLKPGVCRVSIHSTRSTSFTISVMPCSTYRTSQLLKPSQLLGFVACMLYTVLTGDSIVAHMSVQRCWARVTKTDSYWVAAAKYVIPSTKLLQHGGGYDMFDSILRHWSG